MRINHTYRAHTGNYTPGGNSHRWIVVHNTANTASAAAEARYAETNRHDSSYHFVLDGSGTIYQLLDVTDTAWAVGAWRGCTSYVKNNESINIEVCATSRFTADETAELRELVRYLMLTYGIAADHVIRHRDAHSGHKCCPRGYCPDGDDPDGSAWAALHDTITREDVIAMRPADIWEYTYGGSQNCFNALHLGYSNSVEILRKLDEIDANQKAIIAKLNALPHDVWAYRNPELEEHDAYQIVRDVRDSLADSDWN